MIGKTFELKKAYWSEAIPYISKALGDGGPYSETKALDRSNADSPSGAKGVRFYCVINLKPIRCCAGLWIDIGNKEKNKNIYDLIYSHKAEIEDKMSMPIVWKRKDSNQSSNIQVELNGIDYTERQQWTVIKEFHAKIIKEFNDYVVLPYKNEIDNIQLY